MSYPDPDYKISNNELLKHVFWPEREYFTPSEIRDILNETNRFIDFDQTIASYAGEVARPILRGKPATEFLAEEPYIVQTWNPDGAIKFFTQKFTFYPKPRLIILPPSFRFITKEGDHNIGKNFSAFCIIGKIIIDDMSPEKIYAPGCVILHPDI